MGIVTIDYDTLLLVSIIVFAGVGFFRGWLREGITTVTLLVFVGLLMNPDLAIPVIGIITRVLKLVVAFFREGLFLNLDGMLELYREMPDIFTPEDPYTFLLWATAVAVALSYLGGKLVIGDANILTPLSHLIGGLIGAFNGFIVISLVREYLLKLLDPAPVAAAQVGALGVGAVQANEIAIVVGSQVADMGALQGYALYVAVFLGLIVAALILGKVTNWELGRR
jgi:hypothetical protein